MLLYKKNAKEFRDDVDNNVISEQLENAFIQKIGHSVGKNEKRAWNNSLRFMETIVRRSGVPDDCGVMIEYNIPATCKRIDFAISGHDQDNTSNLIIVELKQWESAEATDKKDLVRTIINRNA